MRRRRKIAVKELINENISLLLKDKEELAKIEQRLEARRLMK